MHHTPECEGVDAVVVQKGKWGDLAEVAEDAQQDAAEVLQAMARALRGTTVMIKGSPVLGYRLRSDHDVEHAFCEIGVRLRDVRLALEEAREEDGPVLGGVTEDFGAVQTSKAELDQGAGDSETLETGETLEPGETPDTGETL